METIRNKKWPKREHDKSWLIEKVMNSFVLVGTQQIFIQKGGPKIRKVNFHAN
jgi:hypothetical protein